MNERKRYIIWNLNSKKYFYALFLPIFCMLIHFFQEVIFNKTDNKILKYNLPLLFYYFLPKLFSIIIIPIRNAKAKGESNPNENNIALRRYHFSIKTEHKKKILIIIYIISLLEVIYKIDDSILNYLNKIERIKILIEKRTGFIIFVPLFSYFLLKKRLFKHHLLALFILLFGETIILITLLILGYSTFKDWLYHLINIFFSSFFSLSLVLIKYIFVKYSILSPYNFLLYDGIFCIINSLLCTLLEYFVINNIKEKDGTKDPSENFFKNNYAGIYGIFKNKDGLFYVSFFISFFASFGYFICNVQTIFNFSPYLNVLTDFLTPCLLNILYFIFFEKKKNYILFSIHLIGFALIIFGALILNEIIIFNFWGLNENTYLNISKRGESECDNMKELIANDENDDLDDDNNNINGTVEGGEDCVA